jgi:peptide/nickel transport system permease protein
MLSFLGRRIGLLLLTLLMTSVIVFAITQVLPGDIAQIILGREAGESALESLRVELGLDQPVHIRYLQWLSDFVQGDWGQSYSTRTAVFPLVMQRLRNSLMLAVLTALIAIPLSIGLGVLAGLQENRPLDHVVSIGSLSVVGLPEFITGILLIQVFAFGLNLLPANSSMRVDAGFFEALPMLVLPALTASLVLLAYVARMTRAGVIDEQREPYVRTAELKGLDRFQVTRRHVLRNALLPTITVIAVSIGWMLSGLVVIENLFNYPGLGRLMIFAIERRDVPLLQAIMIVTVIAFTLANLAADFLYAVLNPKIRLDGR